MDTEAITLLEERLEKARTLYERSEVSEQARLYEFITELEDRLAHLKYKQRLLQGDE